MAVNYSKQSERRAAPIKGIAAYAREQKTLLRLARRYSGFTSADFDRWFYGRDQRRPKFSAHGIDGDTFLLGYGESGYSRRNFMLDLLKHMIRLGFFSATRDDNLIVYSLTESGHAAYSG